MHTYFSPPPLKLLLLRTKRHHFLQRAVISHFCRSIRLMEPFTLILMTMKQLLRVTSAWITSMRDLNTKTNTTVKHKWLTSHRVKWQTINKDQDLTKQAVVFRINTKPKKCAVIYRTSQIYRFRAKGKINCNQALMCHSLECLYKVLNESKVLLTLHTVTAQSH